MPRLYSILSREISRNVQSEQDAFTQELLLLRGLIEQGRPLSVFQTKALENRILLKRRQLPVLRHTATIDGRFKIPVIDRSIETAVVSITLTRKDEIERCSLSLAVSLAESGYQSGRTDYIGGRGEVGSDSERY